MPTQIKEHPIIFSTNMVKAILENRKSQTRRVIRKPERLDGLMNVGEAAEWCPYGQPGDLLWVKETWSPWADKPTEVLLALGQEMAVYKADYIKNTPSLDVGGDERWHSSRFMPKKYARIWLRITNVRVERVQEIKPHEILKEGIEPASLWGYDCDTESRKWDEWIDLWNSINAKRGYSWESNPWVWVIEFERVKP